MGLVNSAPIETKASEQGGIQRSILQVASKAKGMKIYPFLLFIISSTSASACFFAEQ